MKVVAFVPIRLNSKRVVGKNLKMLNDKPLLQYVFETLVNVEEIDEVYAFCSSESIVEYLPKKVKFLKRDVALDDDFTLGEDIYDAFVKAVDADVYALVHTTSPFLKVSTLSMAVSKVTNENYDSALSVEKIQTFAWYNNKPLNYSLSKIPRTQDITPVYIETSGFYVFKKNVWMKKHQRVGDNPFFAVVDKIEGIDIDTPEDFEFANNIFKTR